VTAYATGADMVTRYDVDLLGDLATDDREELDPASVPTAPKLLAVLDDASGEIDVALQVGGQYSPSQLAGLTGNSRSHLIRITCSIAITLLLERRPSERYEKIAEYYRKIAKGHLESLRSGQNVFGLDANIAAGTQDVATISAVEVDNLNGLTARMPRMFPQADTRLPRRQG
jgi:phage gp36-like protein